MLCNQFFEINFENQIPGSQMAAPATSTPTKRLCYQDDLANSACFGQLQWKVLCFLL